MKNGVCAVNVMQAALNGPRDIAALGDSIGRYRLLCPIGVGGMARIWLAQPEGGLTRTVALKVIRAEYAADEEYSRMLIDEAMVASAVDHPNVCETYELNREQGPLFIVMEWVPGDSLAGLLRPGGTPLPEHIAARIVADACAGLHAAHEAVGPDGEHLAIVHRDMSPPNILLSIHGHVKVSDFGIAKARHQLHTRTRTGVVKGKFAYLAPEQILGEKVDRRTDVYAMGCVLYVATLGARPFGADATAIGKIVQGKFVLPREVRADYPEELEAIVVRALANDPADRYETAAEMRLELEHWLLSKSHLVTHGDIARVVRERMPPDKRQLVDSVLSSRDLPRALLEHLASMDKPEPSSIVTSDRGMQASGIRLQSSDDKPTVRPGLRRNEVPIKPPAAAASSRPLPAPQASVLALAQPVPEALVDTSEVVESRQPSTMRRHFTLSSANFVWVGVVVMLMVWYLVGLWQSMRP